MSRYLVRLREAEKTKAVSPENASTPFEGFECSPTNDVLKNHIGGKPQKKAFDPFEGNPTVSVFEIHDAGADRAARIARRAEERQRLAAQQRRTEAAIQSQKTASKHMMPCEPEEPMARFDWWKQPVLGWDKSFIVISNQASGESVRINLGSKSHA